MIKYSLVRKNRLPSLLMVSDDNKERYVGNAQDIFDIMKEANVCDLPEEYVYLLSINTRGRVLGFFEVSHGDTDVCHVSPAQIIIRLLLTGGRSAVIVHNHPSGDTSPSSCDIELTKTVKSALDVVQIKLLDHVIVSSKSYISMADMKML